VFAGEAPPPPSKLAGVKLPGTKLMVLAAVIVMILSAAGIVYLYILGSEELRQKIAEVAGHRRSPVAAVAELISDAQRWALTMGLAAGVAGAALFLVTLMGSRLSNRKWRSQMEFQVGQLLESQAKTHREAETRIQRLLGQSTDARVSEEEARKAEAEALEKVAEVTRAYEALQREVANLKEAEKALAAQAQVLERSKGSLELHVQARTNELAKLQRNYGAILDSAGQGICGFDPTGRTMFMNPAGAATLGWAVSDLLGKPEELVFFPPKPKGEPGGPGFAKDANGVCLTEQTVYRKDGSCLVVEYLRTPMTEHGRPAGSVVVFKDITERKLAEDKLTHKAAELTRSNSELEQFAFVASHDLQEPLRKIQAFGDRLKLKCEAVKLEEGRDYLDRMLGAAARMQTLINDLLTFSRVISSSQEFVAVNLSEVTREVLVDLEHRIEKTGAEVTVGKLPTVEADPTQMRQLMQNLIGNALKFQTPGATPAVRIEARLVLRDGLRPEGFFPVSAGSAGPEDKFCVLTVQDNGIGFDEQYLEKIFVVFQRLHGRSEYEGTGVGLAVCRRITDRHGGVITARSQPGEGATFFVVLPVRQVHPDKET
jgi:PAS domain S-box-containing protein